MRAAILCLCLAAGALAQPKELSFQEVTGGVFSGFSEDPSSFSTASPSSLKKAASSSGSARFNGVFSNSSFSTPSSWHRQARSFFSFLRGYGWGS